MSPTQKVGINFKLYFRSNNPLHLKLISATATLLITFKSILRFMNFNHPNLTRRKFIRTSSAMLGAANFPSLASAIEPIKRNGDHKFKYSLAAYSYRKLLQGDPAEMSLYDFIDDCASFGLEGTELTSYYFPKEVTKEYLLSLKEHCFRLGLSISGTAVGNDFGHPEGDPKRREQIDHVKTWVDHAAVMGAPAIRIFAGHTKKGQTKESSHKLMVSAIEECCEYAGQRGVVLALENHGGPTATSDGLMNFIKDVKSPWFAVNLDTGNFSSDDIYAELEEVAPYAMNVQVKVVTRNAEREAMPTDFKRLGKILKDSSYRGFVVLEYEESGDPRKESAHYLDILREALA